MIALLIGPLAKLALAWGAPKWLAHLFGWATWIAIVLATAGGLYLAIHHDGETKGAAKITAKVEQQHTARVAEARQDERHAQVVTDRIGARVAAADDATTDFLRDKLKDLHDALDATPPAAGAAPIILDPDRLSAPVNAVVERANRAAEAADAVGRPDADRAPVPD